MQILATAQKYLPTSERIYVANKKTKKRDQITLSRFFISIEQEKPYIGLSL
jgi:hypothetical protein